MVHKKYIKRGNAVFGPYLYENYRVNGVTKTRYLGIAKEERSGKKNEGKLRVNKKFFYFGIGVAVLILLLVLSYSVFFSGLTGRAALSVAPYYNLGENISGELRVNLKSGELLPMNSKLIISLGDDVLKEVLISELVRSNSEGDFYVEGVELSGEGKGYGFAGERVSYPDVFFKLKVVDEGDVKRGKDVKEEDEGEVEVEEVIDEDLDESGSDEEVVEVVEVVEGDESEDVDEVEEEDEVEEVIDEGGEEEVEEVAEEVVDEVEEDESDESEDEVEEDESDESEDEVEEDESDESEDE